MEDYKGPRNYLEFSSGMHNVCRLRLNVLVKLSLMTLDFRQRILIIVKILMMLGQ